jgi:hypothetical protein
MRFSMTFQQAGTRSLSVILEIEAAIDGGNHMGIKIDQMRIPVGQTLQTADSVGVVAGITGCFHFHDMFVMDLFPDIVARILIVFCAVMAGIAERIG